MSTPEMVYECMACDYVRGSTCEACYVRGPHIYAFCNRSRLAVSNHSAASSECDSEVVDEIIDCSADEDAAELQAFQDK